MVEVIRGVFVLTKAEWHCFFGLLPRFCMDGNQWLCGREEAEPGTVQQESRNLPDHRPAAQPVALRKGADDWCSWASLY